jgi:hypothetical protein
MTPTEKDFDVEVQDGGVRVLFKPTESEFAFPLLVDPEDIAKYGPVSRCPNVRHGASGDTGNYDSSEVAAMALAIAQRAVE